MFRFLMLSTQFESNNVLYASLPHLLNCISGFGRSHSTYSEPHYSREKARNKVYVMDFIFISFQIPRYNCRLYAYSTVLPIDPKICQETGLLVVNQVEGYISGTDVTLAKCVLAFKMAPDQRLNLTLLDFTASSAITLNSTASGGENQLHADSSSLCLVQVCPMIMHVWRTQNSPAES